MDLALLVLRLAVGLFFVGHGAQKLWGSFGGHGLDGTGQFFESLGIRPGRRNALAAGVSEFWGGVLLALGLLTPLGAVLIISVMTVAIITVHYKNGPWVSEGGYEYNLVLAATAFVVAAAPGGWSLDAAFGWNQLHGTAFALAALVIGVIGGFAAVSAGRSARHGDSSAELGGTPATETIVAADEVAAAADDRTGRIAREEPSVTRSPRP
jgi:putative oxidoreductase